MARHRSTSRGRSRQPKELHPKPPNVLQTNRSLNDSSKNETEEVDELTNIKSLLIDDITTDPKPGTSSSKDDKLNTASLHDELDTFRQRWKRELESKSSDQAKTGTDKLSTTNNDCGEKENIRSLDNPEVHLSSKNPPDNPQDVYALAKKLFLAGVGLEQDDMHHESIRFYKQAIHLYPDIERQVFRERNEGSNVESTSNFEGNKNIEAKTGEEFEVEKLPLYVRISSALRGSFDDGCYFYCRPKHKQEAGVRHISELPQDILLRIYRHVVGEELDLASLEFLGLVCRGFFLLTRDESIWRSICYKTWGEEILAASNHLENRKIDWRKTFLERPRVNCDGVYISRTRYIRQGDVGFQDITYRPFHIIRYYRYLRFFPDKRVLILTTNEEPEKIIPIFRHALHAKQFSSELSVLEGSYELVDTNQLKIIAEKDFTLEKDLNQYPSHNQKRHARYHWSRQTPLSQEFEYKFELKTLASRPYRNNVLKWTEYSITSRLESGEEITSFDLNSDSFPNLAFSRVKSFNLKQTKPLSSH